jgi:hypothetical protein
MDEFENKKNSTNKDGKEMNEILSKMLAGRGRTYFFDLKKSKNNDIYLVITESKRSFNAENGAFSYEKHKLFIQKEDMHKFQNELGAVMEYVNANLYVADVPEETAENNVKTEETE